MSILIIDSDVGSEVELRGFFSEQGFHQLHIHKTAESAKLFIQEAEKNRLAGGINLIVIASKLDDADGFKLCRELRSSATGKAAYILVLVSSIENKTDIVKAKKNGANNFAVKPYKSNNFLKQLLGFSLQRVVFLVEDDPVVRQLVSSLLYKKNVELLVADDGTHAYNLINAMMPPKLVIMDIGLPGINGIKLVEHIRSKNIWKRTPILMLTASTDVKDVKKSLEKGANDYIAKPFEIPSFIQRLEKYFPEGE